MSGIIYGDQNIFLPSHGNYGRYVLDNILKFKDKVALINGASDEITTFGELAQKAVNLTSYLKEQGVKQNDVVAVCSENRTEYMVTVIAVFSSGATLACINNAYSDDEMAHSLDIAKPKYIILSPEAQEKYSKIVKSVKSIEKIIVFENKSKDADTINFDDIIKKNVDVNTYKHVDLKGGTALILYSSGTTGLAKGAKITHTNLITSAQQPLPSTRDLITIFVSPWSSTMGLICSLHEIVVGRTIAYLPRFNERQYLYAIQKYKIAILTIVPPVVVILCKSTIAKEYDISSVEIIYSGGAPLNMSVITELKSKYPHIKHVLQGYGMTEATGALTAESEDEYKEGSVGKIVTGNIMKIVDVETRKILGPGQTGEVCVKGAVQFDGYIGKDSKDEFDEDGFYKTGDIAYYDEDGYFYIVDRIKELIKYKAWQVPPSELEDLLLQHAAVKDAAVSARPDVLAGELPTAFIVKQPNANVTERDIVEFIDKKVSPWKKLRGGVIFVKEIPKTSSGKIIRRKLREMLPKLPASKL
ncbi:PREDICTED: 4-coumarate--CoA ligase 1-like [Papilio polytes]|uniref:4-coumarate--CoA ligase 1-like n=1 Tax=Papilio polytes TaxID=76194 RepID=UPI000675BC1B|nr:PREDICTED: 4-coumarate--CoA ligase 1-like [Papilio polytes]